MEVDPTRNCSPQSRDEETGWTGAG